MNMARFCNRVNATLRPDNPSAPASDEAEKPVGRGPVLPLPAEGRR